MLHNYREKIVNLPIPFIVLLEKSRLRRVLASVMGLLALAGFALGPNVVYAQTRSVDGHVKVAKDLSNELGNNSKSRVRWARDINGARYVQLI